MKKRIWIWTHEWDDGRGDSLFHSEEAANTCLWEYVKQEWAEDEDLIEEFGPIPENQEEGISKFRDYHEQDEWHFISSQMVEFPEEEKPEDEVELTPLECEAICAALCGDTALFTVMRVLQLDSKQAIAIINSAYERLCD